MLRSSHPEQTGMSRSGRSGEDLAQLAALARVRGGSCLSEAYVNARTKLRWRCAQGHVWDATASCVKSGTWCPQCAGRRLDPLAEAHTLAAAHGGTCFSKVYVGASVRMSWRCAEGHRWQASLSAVLNGGWCRLCLLPGRRELEGLAAQRGGRCLSRTLRRRDQMLSWACANGHVWAAPWDSVVRGTWCRQCADEAQRGKPKPRVTLLDAQTLAERHGGVCKSTTVIHSKAPLEWCCAAGHAWSGSYANVRRGAWCPVCRADKKGGTIAAMQRLASAHGGRCLSEIYVQCEAKLTWECASGHRWDATARKIRGGRWCPRCASNRRGSLDELRALATTRGGRCLSSTYVNCTTPIHWRCGEGHEWTAIPASIKAGRWCPACAVDRRRRPPGPQTGEEPRNPARRTSGYGGGS